MSRNPNRRAEPPAPPPRSEDETPSWRRTEVVRTLWPAQAGTVALAQQYGKRLVCVRYRHDAKGLIRYTTIELVVNEARIKLRPKANAIYGVQVWWGEAELAKRVRAAGAEWDPEHKLWRMHGKTVKLLGLQHRIRQR